MNCQACDGTGDGRKFGDRNCSICNGSGSVCDVCGEAVAEGEDVCGECEGEREEDLTTENAKSAEEDGR